MKKVINKILNFLKGLFTRHEEEVTHLAALVTKGSGIQWIPNPMNLNEVKKILNCQNLGLMEVQLSIYTWYILCWSLDDPDMNDVDRAIVTSRFNNKTIIDKRRCLLLGVPKWGVLGVKNYTNSRGYVYVYNTRPLNESEVEEEE